MPALARPSTLRNQVPGPHKWSYQLSDILRSRSPHRRPKNSIYPYSISESLSSETQNASDIATDNPRDVHPSPTAIAMFTPLCFFSPYIASYVARPCRLPNRLEANNAFGTIAFVRTHFERPAAPSGPRWYTY